MKEYDAELELSKAAVRLRAVSPDAWDGFQNALRAYDYAVTLRCISSPPDTLHVAQGQARAVAHLVKLLDEAPAMVERMAQKGK